MDRFVVNYLSSGRDLLTKHPTTPSNEIVVLANPDFDAQVAEQAHKVPIHRPEREPLGALPGTMHEAAALTRLFGSVSLFTDSRATAAALRTVNRPAILHVATHGFFNPVEHNERKRATDLVQLGDQWYEFSNPARSPLDNPLQLSGLALSGANNGESDWFVSALEISALRLDGTQLVVLSACDTGRGTTRSGEEFAGLRRAISIAGAASQVTSLWKVDDISTAKLMEKYYGFLLKGKGRAEALQLAQRRVRQDHSKWRHPYFWAAFIASGDWTPIMPLVSQSVRRGP